MVHGTNTCADDPQRRLLRARILILSLLPLVIAATLWSTHSAYGALNDATTEPIAENNAPSRLLRNVPLAFEPAPDAASHRFLMRGNNLHAYLGAAGVVIIPHRDPDRAESRRPLELNFVDADPNAAMEGRELLPGKTNYMLGSDPARWRTNVDNFARVAATGVYPGIDVLYYGNGRELEFDFVVAPGVDPQRIRLEIDGAESIVVTESGDLAANTVDGSLRLRRPHVYQDIDDDRQIIDASYVATLADSGSHQIRFQLGAYDPAHELVIDPILTYATRLGGDRLDDALDVAMDADGNVYLTGVTFSASFPGPGAAVPAVLGSPGESDVFVTKLANDGSTMIFTTILGGTRGDQGESIAVDDQRNVYVTGRTSFFGSGFPTTPGAVRGSAADFFVSKLDPTGANLLYSTFFGGLNIATISGLAVGECGATNCIYVVGRTARGYPTTGNAYQTRVNGFGDAFLTVLDPSGTGLGQLVYSTVFGGSSGEGAEDVVADDDGNAYVTGATASSDFPLMHAFDTTFNQNTEAFMVKFDTTQSGSNSLVYSTFMGGSPGENGTSRDGGIALDATGVVLVAGTTTSSNFPVSPEALKSSRESSEAFLVAIDTSLTGSASLRYSSFLGGSGTESGTAVAAGEPGVAYVTGATQSSNLPGATGGAAPKFGAGSNGRGQDAYVMKIDWTREGGNSLVDSAYIGGDSADFPYSVAADQFGNVAIAGTTSSNELFLPTPGLGSADVFVAGLSTVIALPDGAIGAPSLDMLTTNFGTPPYGWTLVDGAPPAGLTLETDGTLVGDPELEEIAYFTAEITDALGEAREQSYRKRIGIGANLSDIILRKSGATPVPGRILDYYILIRNRTDQPLTNVKVFEQLDPWFRFVSSSPAHTQLDQATVPAAGNPVLTADVVMDRFVYWTIPQIAARDMAVINYKVYLSPEVRLGLPVRGTVCKDDDNCSDLAVQCMETGFAACEATCAAEDSFLPTNLWDLFVEVMAEDTCTICYEATTQRCRGEYFSCLRGAVGEECMELSPTEGTTAQGCCDEVIRDTDRPVDPNEKVVGSGRYIPAGEVLGYQIHFENIGTIEAKDVFLTDQLDDDLDIDSVRVWRPDIGLEPLPVDATVTLYNDNDEVWEVTLDGATRTLEWQLLNIDLPAGATDSVYFVVQAPDGLPSGTEIRNDSTIQFEVFETITTNETLNIVDGVAPTCNVDPLPAISEVDTFNVSWGATDPLGEIAYHYLYVSTDGGAFEHVPTDALATSIAFEAEFGSDYDFYCTARDSVGNVEEQTTGGEASTTVQAPVPNVPPVADAGPEQATAPGTAVTLDGSSSFDPDAGPDALTFSWRFVELPAGSGLTDGSLTGAATAIAGFTPDAAGSYRVALTVSDGEDTDADEVGVTAVIPSISVRKQVSIDGGGFVDADVQSRAPPAPSDASVAYRLIVGNEGDEDLTDVAITDAAIGIDQSTNDLLAGEQRVIDASDAGFEALGAADRCAAPGAIVNIATATARGALSGATVSASDAAWAECEAPTPLPCDVDRNSQVDRNDVIAIMAARGQTAPPADVALDTDGDGIISLLDARQCVLLCTNAGCAP